jgi:uncharacterized RmlC-like cupin family protein
MRSTTGLIDSLLQTEGYRVSSTSGNSPAGDGSPANGRLREARETRETGRPGRVYRGAARRSGPSPGNPAADCPVIGGDQTYPGKQGLAIVAGISAESVGARGLCLHLVTIPPGGRGHAHVHGGHETALYVLTGIAKTRFGPGLRRRVTVRARDFHYIPAGVSHLPINVSPTEPFVAVVARTDPREQESVVLLPELEEMVPSLSHPNACPSGGRGGAGTHRHRLHRHLPPKEVPRGNEPRALPRRYH